MSDSRHPAPRDSSESGKDRETVEHELAVREASIQDRLETLEGEIATAPAAIKTSILRHPFLGLAGAVAAGLAVGLLVTRKKKPDVEPFHRRLVDDYIRAVGEDVRRRVVRGRAPQDAVSEALEGRAPLVVYAPVRGQAHESKGFWSELGDIALKTALGFAVKVAIDAATATIDVEDLAQMIVAEEEQAKSSGAAHAGDGAAGVDRPADLT